MRTQTDRQTLRPIGSHDFDIQSVSQRLSDSRSADNMQNSAHPKLLTTGKIKRKREREGG